MRRQILALIGLAVVVSCQDSTPSGAPPLGPSFDISEGRSGGNPELFFGTPLATNPHPGDVNFDVGAAHALVQPFARVCETNGAPNATGCLVDVTLQTTGSATGILLSFNQGSEFYNNNWHTNQLDPAKDYRIEIWGVAFVTAAEKAALDPRWLFGWRDVRNSPNVSACTTAQAFCLINFGQTVPVKVRIEQFVFCPLTRNCGMQFVFAATNANLEAQFAAGSAAPSAQVFIPGQSGTNFALAIEPCSAAEDAAVINVIDVPTFGPTCLKTVTPFTGVLGTAAIISLCDNLDASGFGLTHDQEEQVEMHHVTSDLSRVQALPAALLCTAPTSGVAARPEPEGLLRFAYAVRDKVLGWAMVKPLFATTATLDRGGGGESNELASFFKLALPAKFEYVSASDASQEAKAGSTVLLSAKVTDLFGEPVKNARVRWNAIVPPNDGATVLGSIPVAPTLTNAAGIAQNTATLNSFRGFNVFHAFGRGIADDRATGCVVPPSTASTCEGPRSAFDPFMPFHVPEFDASGVESPVELPLGTRLMFTIFGKGKPAP